MPLVAYTPPRREIKANEGQVLGEIQGLSLEHVATLVHTHLPDLDALAELFESNTSLDSMTAHDWVSLAMPLITQAPGFVANVIALAANEPTAAPTVQTWPMVVQVNALVDVFELTFEDLGQVKKLLETVAALLKKNKKKG